MALGVSLNSFFYSVCALSVGDWTHYDVTLYLVQSDAVLRRVSSHTLYPVGM